jgi:hypothetical protein
MAGCASFGGCDNSRRNGGPGCHLCDVIAPSYIPRPRPIPLDAPTERERALTRKQERRAGRSHNAQDVSASQETDRIG